MIRLGPPSAAALAALFAAGCASVGETGSAHETLAPAPVEAAAPAPEPAEAAPVRLAALGLRGVSAPAEMAEPAPAPAEPPAAWLASADASLDAPGVIATAPERSTAGRSTAARAGRVSLADGGSSFAAMEHESPAAPPTDPDELTRLLDDFAVASHEPAPAPAPAMAEAPATEVAATEPASAPAAEPEPMPVAHAAAEPMAASPVVAHDAPAPMQPATSEPVKLAMAEPAPAPETATDSGAAEVVSDAPKGEASTWYAGRPTAAEWKSPVQPAPSNHPTLEQVTQFQYCAPAQRLPGRRLIECQ